MDVKLTREQINKLAALLCKDKTIEEVTLVTSSVSGIGPNTYAVYRDCDGKVSTLDISAYELW